jgi:hypothetical protein
MSCALKIQISRDKRGYHELFSQSYVDHMLKSLTAGLVLC